MNEDYKLPKGYRFGKTLESFPERNPDIDPRKWIKWDEEFEYWHIHDPTSVIKEVCRGKPDCKLWINHDPKYGLLPSIPLAESLRKHARCESCGAPPQTDLGICVCGAVCGSPFGEATVYRVRYEVWENELESLCNKEWGRVKSKKRYLQKQLSRLKFGKPYCSTDIEKLRLIQNSACYYCGSLFSDDCQIEHLEPLSQGGADTIHNIMLACSKCNLEKGTLNEVQFWRVLKRRLSEADFEQVRKSANSMKLEKRKWLSS